MRNKQIVRHYDRIALSNQDPYWDIDCRGLSDFDKGVVSSLLIKKIIFKRRQISKFINRIDSNQKIMGLALSHFPVAIRSKTLKRYLSLYKKSESRRNFRYNILTEHTGRGKKILDVGCGTSPYYGRLAKENKIYGIDISPAMVRGCTMKWSNGFFINGDAKNMAFKPGSFDISCSFGLLILYKKIFDYLKELIRVTKETIIFDIMDSDELPYVSPWHLSALCKYYLGTDIARYQHDLPEIRRYMEGHNFYLHDKKAFIDGITDSNKILVFKKR